MASGPDSPTIPEALLNPLDTFVPLAPSHDGIRETVVADCLAPPAATTATVLSAPTVACQLMTVLLPTSIDEALAGLADPEVMILAGGTDFMVEVNAGRRRPEKVLHVGRIEALRGWERHGDTLRLGAAVTYADLMRPPVADLLPALAQAARTVGSPQIRNAGTIGGNLATASPAGDTLPVLSALDAVVEVAGPAGLRDVPIADFITGVKSTALGKGELVIAVRVPILGGPQDFRKVGVRNAMVISIASLALALDLAGRSVRCALGSVGPGPLRATEAEAWLAAAVPWEDLRGAGVDRLDLDLGRFGRLVAAAARPIDDHRGTAEYRRHVVGVLAERAAVHALSIAAAA